VHDNFTVRVSLEVVLLLQLSTEMSVVVNLTVDAKNNAFVFVNERLGTTVCKPKITRLDAGYQRENHHRGQFVVEAHPLLFLISPSTYRHQQ
jgi:hypothetical protein